MDWAKAKSILIWIFCLLNIFLLVVLLRLYKGDGISKEVIENTKLALKDRGVIVACEIPGFSKQLGRLTYKKTDIDKQMIIEKLLGKNITGSDSEIFTNGKKILQFLSPNSFVYQSGDKGDILNGNFTEKSVKEYIGKIFEAIRVQVSDFYVGNTIYKSTNTLVLYEKYNGVWVFDNYILFSISQEGYISIKYQRSIIDGQREGNKIIPAHQVLLKGFTGSNNIVISDIDIGYMKPRMDIDSINSESEHEFDAIPVWRIIAEDNGKLRSWFFYGYNGDEVKYDDLVEY